MMGGTMATPDSGFVQSPSSPAASARAVKNSRKDDYFFLGMAAVILATILFGFSRSYFLAGMWNAPLPNLLIHVHAVVFSSWILLFILQIVLVSINQVKWHRTLGVFGAFLAVAVVVLGILAATDSLARGFSPPGSGIDPKTFYSTPFWSIVVFAVLIVAAFRARFDPPAHKRLVLVSTIALLAAAIDRWPVTIIQKHHPMTTAVLLIFILTLVAFDFLRLGRIHRATLWAGLTVVISKLLIFPIGQTALWHSFAARAIRLWTVHTL